MPDPATITLFSCGAPMRSTVGASIAADGGLIVAGCDGGPVVREVWGDGDYEYALTVPAAEKDRLLLALLAHHYGGRRDAFAAIRSVLVQASIPHGFDSRV